MFSVGVIGLGLVGGVVSKAIEDASINLKVYDKYKKIGSVEDVISTKAVFVCVPTPTKDGLLDLTSLCDVLSSLEKFEYKGLVIIKCTILPGTMEWIISKFDTLKLAHNPEFLTGASSRSDFYKQPAILISCDKSYLDFIENLFARITPAKVLHFRDYKVTEMAKYVHNCFLATKVSFLNEVYEYCEKNGIKYDDVIAAAISQDKIGSSHTKVPGPDGRRGYGGTCFTNEPEALLGADPSFSILQAAVNYNKKIRHN